MLIQGPNAPLTQDSPVYPCICIHVCAHGNTYMYTAALSMRICMHMYVCAHLWACDACTSTRVAVCKYLHIRVLVCAGVALLSDRPTAPFQEGRLTRWSLGPD